MTASHVTLGSETYVLTFEDNFDAPALDAFQGHGSGGVWATSFSPHLDDMRSLASNGENQYYVDPDDPALPNPFSIEDGALNIRAAPLTAEQQALTGGLAYGSGLISTELSFGLKTGYVEVRVKASAQTGFLCALWLLPADDDWSAEIDVFETLGRAPDLLNTNVWDDGVPDQQTIQSADLSADFHTYGLQWTEETITWMLDGVAVRTVANTVGEEMHLALSLAVDTEWTGPAAPDTDFSDAFEIDYIRVYEAEDSTDRNEAISDANPFQPKVYGGARTDDALYGTRWDDAFRGRAGDDELHGRAGDDALMGNAGADALFGGAGADLLKGGSGDDKLYGGDDQDQLRGGRGADELYGEDADDVLKGGHGDDALYGGAGADVLKGGRDADRLFGGTGDDHLNGGAGDDHLVGGAGADVIHMGRGQDQAWGGDYDDGAGADTFVFHKNADRAFIHDFDASEDMLDLTALGLDYAGAALILEDQGWAAALNFSAITGDESDILLLKDVAAADLSAANFVDLDGA